MVRGSEHWEAVAQGQSSRGKRKLIQSEQGPVQPAVDDSALAGGLD